MSSVNVFDDLNVIPKYFRESTHCSGLPSNVSEASRHSYLGPIAIQCDFWSLNCQHNSLPVKVQTSSSFCNPDTDDDNNTVGLGHAYRGRTFYDSWEQCGLMPFLPPPVTHMDTSGS